MTRRHFQNIPPIDPELERLIEHIRALPPMTPEEREEQRRSFAFGNCAIDNPAVTRELVDRVADANPVPPVPQSPHLGHHYGPVHPGIVEYTLPK